MRIVLLGPPGVGKGTQAERICHAFDIPAISTGDILREAAKAGTELGRKADEYMSRGDLVPDDVMIGIIRERLAQEDAAGGFILDGFPRTVAQAEALHAALAESGLRLDAVLALSAPEDAIVERISGRLVCGNCCAVFHKTANPPAEEGVCDACGGNLTTRADDTPEAVRRRLQVYREKSAPLMEYYKERSILKDIDSSQSREAVAEDIEAALTA